MASLSIGSAPPLLRLPGGWLDRLTALRAWTSLPRVVLHAAARSAASRTLVVIGALTLHRLVLAVVAAGTSPGSKPLAHDTQHASAGASSRMQRPAACTRRAWEPQPRSASTAPIRR